MNENPILIDSSVYIDWDRAGLSLASCLLFLTEHYEVAICGPVCCEVGSGFRHASQRSNLQAVWQTLTYVPTDNRLWQESEDLLWQLGRKGRRIPLPDVVIACCAKRINAVLLTHDRHFDLIPDLKIARHLKEL